MLCPDTPGKMPKFISLVFVQNLTQIRENSQLGGQIKLTLLRSAHNIPGEIKINCSINCFEVSEVSY